MKNSKPQFSENIGNFCKMLEEVKQDYNWNYDEVNKLEKLTQDYLHKLEFGGLTYKERAKIATQLSICRQQRRASKDTVETLRPLIDFLESDKGKNFSNTLKDVLGQTRKIEEKMEYRTYRNRVLDEN